MVVVVDPVVVVVGRVGSDDDDEDSDDNDRADPMLLGLPNFVWLEQLSRFVVVDGGPMAPNANVVVEWASDVSTTATTAKK